MKRQYKRRSDGFIYNRKGYGYLLGAKTEAIILKRHKLDNYLIVTEEELNEHFIKYN